MNSKKKNIRILKTETLIALFSLLIALIMVFFYAPVETHMGLVQKIFYIHVPAAYSMYLGWFICTFFSVCFIIYRNNTWDMLAKSSAEVALLFSVVVLITGSFWARIAWGAYWVWDPRLTSVLLLTLIMLSYFLVRNTSGGLVIQKVCALIAIVGSSIIPLIHISVSKWRGHHPSVIKSGGLDSQMLLTLVVCIVAFTFTCIALIHLRFFLEKQKNCLNSLVQNK